MILLRLVNKIAWIKVSLQIKWISSQLIWVELREISILSFACLQLDQPLQIDLECSQVWSIAVLWTGSVNGQKRLCWESEGGKSSKRLKIMVLKMNYQNYVKCLREFINRWRNRQCNSRMSWEELPMLLQRVSWSNWFSTKIFWKRRKLIWRWVFRD